MITHPFLTSYTDTAVPSLREAHAYASPYMVPRIEKVVVNVGLGDFLTNGKTIDEIEKSLTLITGQKPIRTKARKAIAGFKIRIGMDVGLKVTLRGTRMYDFLTKTVSIALPRTRDFRGIPASGVTEVGTLNIGIRDTSIFLEFPQDGTLFGLQVTVVSTATTREEALALYRALGFPFSTVEA